MLAADDQPRGPWGDTLRAYLGAERARSWQALSLTPDPHRVTRVSPEAFVLDTARPDGFAMHLYRDVRRHPMHAGDRVATRSVTIDVLEVVEGAPSSIRVTGRGSLDDPSLLFASRHGGRLLRVRLPPVGRSIVLP